MSINQLERVIGDYGLAKGLKLKMLIDKKRPEKIAVVGAGPAGLSCAYQLARRGYGVTVFEAADKPGGMLLWGIPRHRLPADIVQAEIQKILDMGVELKCNTPIGRDISLDDLGSQYSAIFAGLSAETGLKLGFEGEPLATGVGQAADLTGVESNGPSTEMEGDPDGSDAANLPKVTTAIGHGWRAAKTIDCKLRRIEPEKDTVLPLIQADRMRLDHYAKKDRVESAGLPVEERLAAMDTEVNQGVTLQQAVEEAKRCLSCGYCFDCEKCWLFCQEQAIEKPMTKGMLYTFNLQKCTGCRKCARECPCGFIDIV